MIEGLLARIENDFATHHCDEKAQADMQKIRECSKSLAIIVATVVPRGREQSEALAHLEKAMFWANSGIARQFKKGGGR